MKCLSINCDNKLTKSQKYEVLRGKAKGYCSKKCAHPKKVFESICLVCGDTFSGQKAQVKIRKVCSKKCSGVLASFRMKKNNPMSNQESIDKMKDTLKKIGHKPFSQGGNGRGATVPQLNLYNELIKKDDSFSLEFIELTRGFRKEFKCPNHYKIDIASKKLMIAIEVDGFSHCSKSRKEQDERKEKILCLKGWKVLRFTNLQIEKELTKCVQAVLSMI